MAHFLSVEEISTGCSGRTFGKGVCECGGVCIDSRTIKQGDCFFAIKGGNFDGHKFVEQAFEGGASCAVVEEGSGFSSSDLQFIEVADTTAALGDLARFYRNMLTAKVIGITGSVGKTSCRDMVAHVLCGKYCCCAAQKSFNNHIGLPLTILNCPRNSEVLILELGTNHPGEIEYLAKIAKPDIAVITKVAPAHIEYFGNIENIAREKASISSGLQDGGKLIINGDSPHLADYLKRNNIKHIAYDIADIDYDLEGEGGWFTVDGVRIDVPLAGKGNLENALAAYYVCREFGVCAIDFGQAIATATPPQMRLNIIDVGRIKIINDCYNANPQSVSNALSVLSGYAKRKSRTVAVLGDMLELGDKSEAMHKQIGAMAADSGVCVVAAVGKFRRCIAAGVKQQAQTIGGKIDILEFANTDKLCKSICNITNDCDVVLFKASRSVGLEKAVQLTDNFYRRQP